MVFQRARQAEFASCEPEQIGSYACLLAIGAALIYRLFPSRHRIYLASMLRVGS